MLAISAHFHAVLDYPDEDIEEFRIRDYEEALRRGLETLEMLLRTFERGKTLNSGIPTAIIGLPNAGKSSLLNALLGESRAIVSATPGTTRDSIEEWLDIDGWPVRLVDTAGLRETNDTIEGEGVARARDLMKKADIVLNLTPADGEPTGGTSGTDGTDGTGVVIEVFSKCDLAINSDDYGSRYHSAVSRSTIATQEESTGHGFRTQSGGAGMHRSAAEGRLFPHSPPILFYLQIVSARRLKSLARPLARPTRPTCSTPSFPVSASGSDLAFAIICYKCYN